MAEAFAENYNLVVWILGITGALFLALLVYFSKRLINSLDKLSESVDKLKDTFNEYKLHVATHYITVNECDRRIKNCPMRLFSAPKEQDSSK